MKIPSSILILIPLFFACEAPQEKVERGSPLRTWESYLGDNQRTHYSELTQVNKKNVSELQLLWTYESGGLKEDGVTQIQTNPLVVKNILYGVNAAMELFAINAETGEELWTFTPSGADETGLGLNRGLVCWFSDGSSPDRLFYSSGNWLYALDLIDGSIIRDFGDQGRIDLRSGLGRDPEKVPIVVTTPGTVYQDLLIMGHRTSESPGAAPGHIRAYNVKTGKMEWIFHTIPLPGEYGYETWPAGAYLETGGANNWAGMALDEENGIVYIPTGSAAFDWYGGDRPGDNLFANSLLALDARSGKRIWHFQAVHHDIWDRDFPASPNLVDIQRDGQTIPAVAQITKSGYVYLFNRLTGDPLFPIEEKEFPSSTLDGEQTSPTQPIPSKPEPFARQRLSVEDLYAPDEPSFVDDFIDLGQNEARQTVKEKLLTLTSEGQFIPTDTKGVILYPGADGGGEWGGAAIDPEKGIIYVNSNEMAWIVRMQKVGEKDGKKIGRGETLVQIHCTRCHGGELQGMGAIPPLQNVDQKLGKEEIMNQVMNGKGAMPAMPNLTQEEIESIAKFLVKEEEATDHRADVSLDLPYAIAGFGRFKDHRGFPVMKPPWGTLNAIDLNTGEYIWKIPLGEEPGFEDPDYPVSGTENYGGPVVTAGGLIFIAATKDEKIRAFDKDSGELLWEYQLPAGGYATPSVYESGGKQYLVIACGGGKMGTPSGDRYLAFGLR